LIDIFLTNYNSFSIFRNIFNFKGLEPIQINLWTAFAHSVLGSVTFLFIKYKQEQMMLTSAMIAKLNAALRNHKHKENYPITFLS